MVSGSGTTGGNGDVEVFMGGELGKVKASRLLIDDGVSPFFFLVDVGGGDGGAACLN